MPVKAGDALRSPSCGSAAEALAHIAGPSADDRLFVATLEAACRAVGLDFAPVMAHVHLESAGLTSPRYRHDRNPSGLGISRDDTPQPFAIPDYATAARTHVSAMNRLVEGTQPEPWALPPSVEAWLSSVWRAHVIAARTADVVVRAIDDLNDRYLVGGTWHATWAWDADQTGKIVERARLLFPSLSDRREESSPVPDLTFGRVEHPPSVDRLIPDVQNGAWDNLGARVPVGVCQHSMVGSLWGTDGWFRRGRQSTGLTDYGIGNSTDGEQWDGVILRWNDPTGKAHTVMLDGKAHKVSANRAGWANGGSDGLEGDGPLFVRTFGVNGINRNLVSIERSDGGDIRQPVSAKQFASIVALTAYWFDWAKVPWDRFPLNPAHGCVTHVLHFEFATKTCPHPPVTNRIDDIQNAVRALLKAAQTTQPGTEPVPVPAPTPVEPNHAWLPRAYTEASLKARFGTLTRHNLDGGVSEVPFNLKGIIANAWIARGAAERIPADQLPRPLDWWALRADEAGAPTHELVLFEGNWTLYRPAPNAAFRWIDAR